MSMDEKLTEIFLSIRGGLSRAVSSIVPPREIEDIVQETYVRACQVKGGRTISSPRSFMYKTAVNIALNYKNRYESQNSQSYEEYIESDVTIATGDLFEQVASDTEFALLCEAVRGLPIQCRRVFVMRKVYGHSQKEIAKMLGISEKTVENHVMNAIKRCRKYVLQDQNKKVTYTNLSAKADSGVRK